MIDAYQTQEGFYITIGYRFQVYWQTVRNWVKFAQDEQRFTLNAHQNGNRSLLQEKHQEYLEALYSRHCDLTYEEVSSHFQQDFQIRMSVSSTPSHRILLDKSKTRD